MTFTDEQLVALFVSCDPVGGPCSGSDLRAARAAKAKLATEIKRRKLSLPRRDYWGTADRWACAELGLPMASSEESFRKTYPNEKLTEERLEVIRSHDR